MSTPIPIPAAPKTSIPMRIQYNSVLVEAVVNGDACLFILDTGDAIGPVFNASDANRLGLKRYGVIGVSGAGGATENYGTVANINLGLLEYPQEPGAIDPYLQGHSLLGLPFFLKVVKSMTFDFVEHKLRLDPK